MAESRFEVQQSRPRADSFQRMLDLEKRYKLSRLHRTQALPTSDSVTSFQLQMRPPSIQSRRRNSRESPTQHTERARGSRLAQRTGSNPTLSIEIPPTPEQKQNMVDDFSIIAAGQDQRVAMKPLKNNVQYQCIADVDERGGEGDADDSRSDQSSICQSPSWEGYGQKKKNKKLEAEQRKKEKEANRTLRLGTRRRPTKRLCKLPPPDSQGPSVAVQDKASQSDITNTKFVQSEGIPDKLNAIKSLMDIDERPCATVFRTATISGSLDGPLLRHHGHTLETETNMTGPETICLGNELCAVQSTVAMDVSPSRTGNIAPIKVANGKTSYPPPSSRSYNLKGPPMKAHRRRKSASAIVSSKLEAVSNIFRARNATSQREPNAYSSEDTSGQALQNFEGRGRKLSENDGAKSYVRQVRAQSIESSISGFMEQAELQSPTAHSNQHSLSPEHRGLHAWQVRHIITSSQAEVQAFDKSQQNKHAQQHKERHLQLDRGEAWANASKIGIEQAKEASDYSDFISKPYTPPSLDLPTPTSVIFSSIKSRISRRGSYSSDTTSAAAQSLKGKSMASANIPVSFTASLSSPAYNQMPEKSPKMTSTQTMKEVHGEAHTSPTELHHLADKNTEASSARITQASSRPSEVSSCSSYHNDSSTSHSLPGTPDTSRPQSAKGIKSFPVVARYVQVVSQESPAFVEDDLAPEMDLNPHETKANISLATQPFSTVPSGNKKEHMRTQPASRSKEKDGAAIGRARDKEGGKSDLEINTTQTTKHFERATSRDYLFENAKRPICHNHILEDTAKVMKDRRIGSDGTERCYLLNRHGPDINCSPAFADGLEILDKSWSHDTNKHDIETLSFVTTLTSQETQLEISPGSRLTGSDTTRPQETASITGEISDSGNRGVQPCQAQMSSAYCKQEKREDTQEEPRRKGHENEQTKTEFNSVQSRPQTSIGPRNATPKINSNPPSTHNLKSRMSTCHDEQSQRTASPASFSSAPTDLVLRTPLLSSSGRSSPSAAYLQEARRSAPMISSPLSSMTRSVKANISSSSLPIRPKPDVKISTSSANRQAGNFLSLVTPLPSASSSLTLRYPMQDLNKMSKPIAKMLVECCRCKFLHDMPSRIYECMAQPDTVVTDLSLGVSGAITTMVKCPWCAHNMSKQCCAGYAAVIYLKERLH